MNVTGEAQNDINEMDHWNIFVEPREQMDNTQEGLKPPAAIQVQVVGVDCPLVDSFSTPFDDCYLDECGAPGTAACIDQLPTGKVVGPVEIGDDANQFSLATFWDIEPEPPSHVEVSGLPGFEQDELDGGSCGNDVKLENFANLTDLEATLGELEVKHLETSHSGNESIAEARSLLLLTIKQFNLTRFDLGKALSAYRAHFRADRVWMAAAKAIARALGYSDRTVRNVIADYEKVAHLQAAVIQVAHAKGVDLAQRRHSPTLAAIELALVNEDDGQGEIGIEEVEQIVSNVLVMQSPNQRELIQNDPFVSLTRAERKHFAVRMKIRTALANVELDRKLSALIAALEEEMFAIWGQKEPVTVTISPRPSVFTLDGRKRQTI